MSQKFTENEILNEGVRQVLEKEIQERQYFAENQEIEDSRIISKRNKRIKNNV